MGCAEFQRLRWQCRRGMLELDEILSRYLERCYVGAEAADQLAFRRLLAVEDPVLNAWLLGGVAPADPTFVRIVTLVRSA